MLVKKWKLCKEDILQDELSSTSSNVIWIKCINVPYKSIENYSCTAIWNIWTQNLFEFILCFLILNSILCDFDFFILRYFTNHYNSIKTLSKLCRTSQLYLIRECVYDWPKYLIYYFWGLLINNKLWLALEVSFHHYLSTKSGTLWKKLKFLFCLMSSNAQFRILEKKRENCLCRVSNVIHISPPIRGVVQGIF